MNHDNNQSLVETLTVRFCHLVFFSIVGEHPSCDCFISYRSTKKYILTKKKERKLIVVNVVSEVKTKYNISFFTSVEMKQNVFLQR